MDDMMKQLGSLGGMPGGMPGMGGATGEDGKQPSEEEMKAANDSLM